jgi:TPR repeat protein
LHSREQPTTEKLIGWIESEAYDGDSMAQYLLGTIYEYGDEVFGMVVDMQKGLFWFEKAANNNIAEAQCKVAQAYWTEHEKYGMSYDPSVALKWFKKAKDIGHPSAKFNYGLLQYTGVGIEKNTQEGIAWIKEARNDGLEHAQEFLENEGLG